jgi:hypothetical protein
MNTGQYILSAKKEVWISICPLTHLYQNFVSLGRARLLWGWYHNLTKNFKLQ